MAKGGVFIANGARREATPGKRVPVNPFAASRGRTTCDIGGADSRVIIAAIGVACAAGVLLTIGGAQGGIGYMVSVYHEGQQHRAYGRDNEELEYLLLLVIEAYKGEAEDPYVLYGMEEKRV